MPRWLTYKTLDPLDPHSGSKTEVKFPVDLVEHLNRNKPVDYYNLRTAAKVLDEPNRIFYGLRPLYEGGWCYVGKPSEWWIREGVVVPFPPKMVFAIYLENNLVVYTFRAEYADANDDLSPRHWDERYQKLVWKKHP